MNGLVLALAYEQQMSSLAIVPKLRQRPSTGVQPCQAVSVPAHDVMPWMQCPARGLAFRSPECHEGFFHCAPLTKDQNDEPLSWQFFHAPTTHLVSSMCMARPATQTRNMPCTWATTFMSTRTASTQARQSLGETMFPAQRSIPWLTTAHAMPSTNLMSTSNAYTAACRSSRFGTIIKLRMMPT